MWIRPCPSATKAAWVDRVVRRTRVAKVGWKTPAFYMLLNSRVLGDKCTDITEKSTCPECTPGPWGNFLLSLHSIIFMRRKFHWIRNLGFGGAEVLGRWSTYLLAFYFIKANKRWCPALVYSEKALQRYSVLYRTCSFSCVPSAPEHITRAAKLWVTKDGVPGTGYYLNCFLASVSMLCMRIKLLRTVEASGPGRSVHEISTLYRSHVCSTLLESRTNIEPWSLYDR